MLGDPLETLDITLNDLWGVVVVRQNRTRPVLQEMVHLSSPNVEGENRMDQDVEEQVQLVGEEAANSEDRRAPSFAPCIESVRGPLREIRLYSRMRQRASECQFCGCVPGHDIGVRGNPCNAAHGLTGARAYLDQLEPLLSGHQLSTGLVIAPVAGSILSLPGHVQGRRGGSAGQPSRCR